MFFQEENLKTCFAFHFPALEIGQNDSEIPDLEFENHDEKIERRNERKTERQKKDEKTKRRNDRKTKRQQTKTQKFDMTINTTQAASRPNLFPKI